MVISKNSSQLIYHEESCPYAKRMAKKYRRYIDESAALERGYRACSYCGGIHGIYLKLTADRTMYGKYREGLVPIYDRIDKGLCIRTQNGFWKVLMLGDPQTYRLWHLNKSDFDPNVESKFLMRRSFHRQIDVQSTTNFGKIIHYIYEHDKAKRIMADDWKKLPKKTPKQKKYYKQAEKREHRKQNQRLDELFEKLQKGEL